MPEIVVTYTKSRTYRQDAEEFFKTFPLAADMKQEVLLEWIHKLVISKGNKGRGAELFNNYQPTERDDGTWHIEIPKPHNSHPSNRTAKRTPARSKKRR